MAPTDQTRDSDQGLQDLQDRAARAYMSADYDEAISLWRKILEIDSSNPRALEGIKKVDMLRDTPDECNPPSPVLDEIQALIDRRRFDEAAEACRRHAEDAGPALLSRLHPIQQQVERARAVEPEILRSLKAARTALKDGIVKDALPHIRQVLALDQDHPLATRLMEAIRQRMKVGSTAPLPPAPAQRERPTPAPAEEEPEELGPLPSSGRPGSDAPPAGMEPEQEPPAPPGEALPSSPAIRVSDVDSPEIELESLSPQKAPKHTAAPDEEEEEVVEDEPTPILLDLDPDPQESKLPRAAQTGGPIESPFLLDNEQPEPAPGKKEVEGKKEVKKKAGPESLDELLGFDAPSDEKPRTTPRRRAGSAAEPAGTGGGSGVRGLLLASVAVVAAGIVAAWWFDLLPGASVPEPQALEVPRAEPRLPSGESADPRPRPAPSTRPAPPRGGSTTRPRPAPMPESPRQDPGAALEHFEAGQDHFEAGRLDEAVAAFEWAIQLDPMNAEIGSWLEKSLDMQEANQQVRQEHQRAVSAFNKKDFAEALRAFYRLQAQEPDGPYGAYIANSWFNWGLKLLAGGNLREAEAKLDEALAANPDDTEAAEVKQLISTYRDRAKDRLFFLRIEALHYRPIDR